MSETQLGPATPARTHLHPPDRERQGLSEPWNIGTPSARRSANRAKIQPASQEVISSLISTLSAISAPAQEHFDNLPDSPSLQHRPSAPQYSITEAPWAPLNSTYVQGTKPAWPANAGFRMEHGAYGSPHDILGGHMSDDDSAASPVIRTSRPPSILSKRSSFRGHFRAGSWETQSGTGRSFRAPSTVGNLSFELGRNVSTTSLVSSTNEGRKSLRKPTSRIFTGSEDPLREISAERVRKAAGAIGGRIQETALEDAEMVRYATPPPDHSMASTSTKGKNKESLEPTWPLKSRSLDTPSPGAEIDSASRRLNGSPRSVGSGRLIPDRQSSLRHTSTVSSRRRSTRTRQLQEVKPEEVIPVPIRSEERPEGVPDKTSNDRGEDDVSKRIRELKARKRDREWPLSEASINPQTPLRALDTKPTSPPPTSISPPLSASASAAIQVAQAKRIRPRDFDHGDRTPMSSSVRQMKSDEIIGNAKSLDGQRSGDESKSQRRPSRVASSYSETIQRTRSPFTDERRRSVDSVAEEVSDYLIAPRLSQKIVHQVTGRVISFSEVGDPDGYAVICCVGMGLTRYITAFYDELAVSLKLRLITPDRPGIGASEIDSCGSDTPLGWPDDVLAICQHLSITKFSILAHSAGAIYALATALRMPQHIRGRIHLLAPWIPPSQMIAIGNHQDPLPTGAVPYSQRILRSLPTPFLRVANSNFLGTTSSSITSSLPKSPRRTRQRSQTRNASVSIPTENHRDSLMASQLQELEPDDTASYKPTTHSETIRSTSPMIPSTSWLITEKERQNYYDSRLTAAIWSLATTNANPAVDLLVCLERRQTIGFRYVDITKSVVISHGTKDTRVPLENVKWLGKTMRRCEVRVLEGEGHGLMASPGVMGNVLMEMAREWEEWSKLVKGRRGTRGRD